MNGPSATPPLAVLVVEDSRIAQRFLEQRLGALGHRVVLVDSAEAALARLAQQAFDVAFVDIGLAPGGMDGLQLCRRLRQPGVALAGPLPKIAILTGLTGASDRVRGQLAGCDLYLTKPLHEDALAAALATLQNRAPQRADRRSSHRAPPAAAAA